MSWPLVFALVALGIAVSVNVAQSGVSFRHYRRWRAAEDRAEALRDELASLKLGDEGARRKVVRGLRDEAIWIANNGCNDRSERAASLLAKANEIEKGGPSCG